MLVTAAARDYGRGVDRLQLPLGVHTPFAHLDLLYGEEEQTAPAALPGRSVSEPGTTDAQAADALDAQILAGLVSP
jgi:hypothetical protein